MTHKDLKPLPRFITKHPDYKQDKALQQLIVLSDDWNDTEVVVSQAFNAWSVRGEGIDYSDFVEVC